MDLAVADDREHRRGLVERKWLEAERELARREYERVRGLGIGTASFAVRAPHRAVAIVEGGSHCADAMKPRPRGAAQVAGEKMAVRDGPSNV